MSNSNRHIYGHYRVGQDIYFDKAAALTAAKSFCQLEWFMFNGLVDTFDWSKEPEEELEFLYAQRARQLRNDYDWLALHYSGGSDSQNVLDTFIKNNIHLDEVILRGTNLDKVDKEYIDPTDPRFGYAEVKYLAYPLAKMIKERYMPHLKITVVDHTEISKQWFIRNPKWYEHYMFVEDPFNIVRADYDLLAPHLIGMVQSGKKVGHILGIDKAPVYIDDEGIYIQFRDQPFTRHILPRTIERGLDYYTELFTFHPSSIDTIAKEAHVMKNWIIANPNNLARWKKESEKIWTRGYEDFISEILWKRMFPMFFKIEKAYKVEERVQKKHIVWPQHIDLVQDPTEDFMKIYLKGLWELQRQLPPNSLIGNKILKGGYMPCQTPKYYIHRFDML